VVTYAEQQGVPDHACVSTVPKVLLCPGPRSKLPPNCLPAPTTTNTLTAELGATAMLGHMKPSVPWVL
jgi:hypothetical protein